MADKEAKVQPAPDGVGGQEAQVKVADQSGAKLKERLVHEPDRERHPAGEPKKEADKSSYPGPNDAELNDPPLRTPYPDVEVIRTLASGAGAHQPPDPKKFEPSGRPR